MTNILCTICARAGSKGLKRKNLLKINRKSLIFYTVDQAKKSGIFTNIVVSTDSNVIKKKIKKENGVDCWFLRSKKLSNDHVSKIDVIKDALIRSEENFDVKYDYIMDLDVTSPLRSIKDIKKAYNIFKKRKIDFLISANISKKNPYFNMVEFKKNKIKFIKKKLKQTKIKRRQDAPKTFDINASMYIWKKKTLLNSFKFFPKKTFLFIMPPERSWDIDSKFDFDVVKFLLEKKKI